MVYSRFRKRFEEIMADADIRIDGDRPWDMQVHCDNVFPRIFAFGSLGMGESYMDGWWSCDQLDELISRVSSANLKSKLRLADLFLAIRARLINPKRGGGGGVVRGKASLTTSLAASYIAGCSISG